MYSFLASSTLQVYTKLHDFAHKILKFFRGYYPGPPNVGGVTVQCIRVWGQKPHTRPHWHLSSYGSVPLVVNKDVQSWRVF